MTMVEDQIADMLARCNTQIGGPQSPANDPSESSRELINGPKLDDDIGYASCTEIDAMFS